MSDRQQQRIQRLPDIHPVWKVVIIGVLAAIVELATGPSLVERAALATVGGYSVSWGAVFIVVALGAWLAWEAWYR